MSDSVTLDDTGERMIPEFHKGTLMYAEHLTRYAAIEDMVKGKIVLDIASGSGYGSYLLSKQAAQVYGVDASADAVAYAQENYQAKNIQYIHGDATAIPLADDSVDIVITLETIEHIEDYAKFMAEIKRVLRPDGLAIVSTPNDSEFAEGNHFHLHEFLYDELNKLLLDYFTVIKPYFQATWKTVAIGPKEVLSTEGDLAVSVKNMAPIPPEKSLYFYMLCSNRPITEEIETVVALGGHYSDRSLVAQELGHKHAHDVANKELYSLREQVGSLSGQLSEAQRDLATTKSHINSILGSKSYRLARKLAAIKKVIKNDK